MRRNLRFAGVYAAAAGFSWLLPCVFCSFAAGLGVFAFSAAVICDEVCVLRGFMRRRRVLVGFCWAFFAVLRWDWAFLRFRRRLFATRFAFCGGLRGGGVLLAAGFHRIFPGGFGVLGAFCGGISGFTFSAAVISGGVLTFFYVLRCLCGQQAFRGVIWLAFAGRRRRPISRHSDGRSARDKH